MWNAAHRLIPLILCAIATLAAAPQGGPVKKLSIVIIEGEGAINNVRQRAAREPIVQVEDENHKPIAGAAVVFLILPGIGSAPAGASGLPGATFAGGSNTATFITDASGRATAQGLTSNEVAGSYRIQVSATSQGQTATTTISMSNAIGGATGAAGAGAAAAKTGGGISTKALIIIGAAAAGGGTLAYTQLTKKEGDFSTPPIATGGLDNIAVGTTAVAVTVWDNAAVDGDIISLAVNGTVVINHLTMGGPPGNTVNLNLKNGNNTLVITAWNEGTSSPNTGAMSVSNVTQGPSEMQWTLATGQTASMTVTVR